MVTSSKRLSCLSVASAADILFVSGKSTIKRYLGEGVSVTLPYKELKWVVPPVPKDWPKDKPKPKGYWEEAKMSGRILCMAHSGKEIFITFQGTDGSLQTYKTILKPANVS